MKRSRILDDQVVVTRARPHLSVVRDEPLELPRGERLRLEPIERHPRLARTWDRIWGGVLIGVTLAGLAIAAAVAR